MAPAGSHSDDAVSRMVGELQRKLQERVRETSEEMLRRLEEELRLDVSNLVEEITPPAPPNTGEELLAAVSRIDSETTQTDIVNALVEEARRFASRSAFFLTRVGEVRGWAGDGWNSAASSLEELRFEPPDEGVWAELARGDGAVSLDADGCLEIARPLETEAGSEGILVPFVLRGKLAGALFADRVGDDTAPDFVSLQLLTHAAAQALETVAFRERGASPALRRSGAGDGLGVPLWQPDDTPAEAEATTPAVVDEEPRDEADALAAGAFEAVEEPEPIEEPETVEEPEPDAATPSELVESRPPEDADAPAEEPVSAFLETPEELALPEEPMAELEYVEPGAPETEEPEVDAEPEDMFTTELVEPSPAEEGQIWEEDEETTVIPRDAAEPALETPPELVDAGQQTVQLESLPDADQVPTAPPVEPPAPTFELEPEPTPMPEPEPPPIPEPEPPPEVAADAGPSVAPPAAEPPPPARPTTGSTEVRPPDDLEGPGLAFSSKPQAVSVGDTGISPGEEALHEEARRLARLLVSEIKLYNEEVIEEGRMAGNIYARLREDIDRSRQMYDERIDPRVQEDYFYQELVQRLAGGDPNLLGM